MHSDILCCFFSDILKAESVQTAKLDQKSNTGNIKLQELNLAFDIYSESIAIRSNTHKFCFGEYRQLLCLVFLLYLASK